LKDEKLQEFLTSVFKLWADIALERNAAWYLWHAHLTQGFFAAAAAAAADVILSRQIIWAKPQLILGRGDYHWKHEPCFYGWRKGHRPPFYGERNQTTVWEIGYEGTRNKSDAKLHPTQKPTGIFDAPMLNHVRVGEICAEPFSGSGSQIIAGERNNRRVFAMELEPKYVAVALERWSVATGKTPELMADGG
jgi:DNA modification methylase